MESEGVLIRDLCSEWLFGWVGGWVEGGVGRKMMRVRWCEEVLVSGWALGAVLVWCFGGCGYE